MIWVALWLGLNVAVALVPTVAAWLRERRRLAQDAQDYATERDAVWAMRQKALLLTREEWEAEQRVLASPFLGDCDEIVRPMGAPATYDLAGRHRISRPLTDAEHNAIAREAGL